MKNKLIFAIVAFLSFSGCAQQPSEIPKEEKESEKKEKEEKAEKEKEEEEKKSEKKAEKEEIASQEIQPIVAGLYDHLIDCFREGMQSGDWSFLGDASWYVREWPSCHLMYAYSDINQDGVDEMLVKDGSELIYLFTSQNGVDSLLEAKPGIRGSFTVDPNGKIIINYFGTTNSYFDIKVLPAWGTVSVVESSYGCERDFDHPEIANFYKEINGERVSISEEEFDVISQQFTNSILSSLIWNEF